MDELNLNVPPSPQPKPERKEKKAKCLTRKSELTSDKPINPVGKRRKRNEAGIKKAQAHFHSLPCVCGKCGRESGNQWCHLDGRSEDVLLDYTLAVPG